MATTQTKSSRAAAAKPVFFFGHGKAEGAKLGKELLGGKGAGLAEMTALGLPVPAGFTITTAVCQEYYANGGKLPQRVQKACREALARVERVMSARFGDPDKPLLVSVRSGARASMPGMMDTILNLGLNDATLEGLIARSGDARFAYDSYRRFITMYADVVAGIDRNDFEHALEQLKHRRGYASDTEVTANEWRDLVAVYKRIYKENAGGEFPADPFEQLWGAVGAVFKSWHNARAIEYRRIYKIPESWGTAVNVQAMVFGNLGADCATGVAFTRDPATGERRFFGEYLVNAQGEDVVAGIRTPSPISIAGKRVASETSLEEAMPKTYKELVRVYQQLERHYRDMQDIEFTIQQGKLWLLQTRTGKRNASAAVRIAVDMANEKLITREEAILRIDPDSLNQLLHPMIAPDAKRDIIAKGLPASPGAATGKVVFSADEAEAAAKRGEKVVLVRVETSPEDIHGMNAAQGILTARGGMTSHAAVVARQMGKCCVAGSSDIDVNYARKQFTASGRTVKEGDIITLDGSKGEVMLGAVATIEPVMGAHYETLMKWVDSVRQLGIRANADTPTHAAQARRLGAQGIGLCRTEHMFFEADRIFAVREMILAGDEMARRRALKRILPMQREDFEGIFQAMDGLPVTIRLLDPPLHEFLPQSDEELRELATALNITFHEVKARNELLKEFNPMLGHRGCRLGVTYPEIYEIQVRAIFMAACNMTKKRVKVLPEIMIPLVAAATEMRKLQELTHAVGKEVMAESGVRLAYKVGTMIELPRACAAAGEIAAYAEFFSFGTNDLTQTVFGLSRDDSGRFLPHYVGTGVLPSDPFVTIDQSGVGGFMRMAVEKGRAARPGLKIGICGEHGGEPESVKFCHTLGLDYVSCAALRVPIARLAAAHAALKTPRAPLGGSKRKPGGKAKAQAKGPKAKRHGKA